MVLVTVDGRDHCGKEESCGMSDEELAFFMKDQVHTSSAMGMDQGACVLVCVCACGCVCVKV